METITNLASTATNAATKLIYGDPATTTTKTNETAGKEPISGEQGKGTVAEPYDQGNVATPLEKPSSSSGTFLDYANNETGGKEPISGVLGKGTAAEPFDQGNSANTVNSSSSTSRPLGSSTDAHTSDFDSKPLGETQATGITDKIWKPNPIDNVSTSIITDAPVDPLTREKAGSDHPFEKSSSTTIEHPTHTPSSIPAPVETPSFPSAERTSHTSTEHSSSIPLGVSKISPIEQSNIPIPVEKSNVPVPVEKPSTSTEKSGIPAVDTAPLEYRYEGTGTSSKALDSHQAGAINESSTGVESAIHNPSKEHHDTKTGTSTGLATEGVHSDASKPVVSGETDRTWAQKAGDTLSKADGIAGLVGEKSSRKSESTTSPVPASSTVDNSGTTHESKLSHIKEKLKDKLHIGHK